MSLVGREGQRLRWAAGIAALLLGCSAPDPRPSVVLIVADTVRADAVSAYGAVDGTTAHLDALAAEGLRYTNATSPSPWTLPSHASLFTGVGIDRHRVGMRGRVSLPDEFVTLAERFQAAGYETAAFSENMLVSDVFDVLQGFGYKRVSRVFLEEDGVPKDTLWGVDPLFHVRQWLEERSSGQPFFLFVNLFDAHAPYEVREENPWVPAGAGPEEMRRYAGSPESLLCDAAPSPRDLAVLRGLYLGDVAEVDGKIGQILEDVGRLGGASNLITIVTSDHGELFGERDLLGHEFTLHQGALHVPLIVRGVGNAPAVLDEPVTLADVAASIVVWTGLEADPPLDGRPLPLSPDEPPREPRPVLAAYSDAFQLDPEEWGGILRFLDKDLHRTQCGPGDKVFGSMASLIDPPFKYQWYERYAPELYDLSWDPDEKSDQISHQPELAARLRAEIAPFLDRAWLTSEPDEPVPGIGPEEAEALKALGYAD